MGQYDICIVCKQDETSGVYTSDGFLLCDSCADKQLEDEEE